MKTSEIKLDDVLEELERRLNSLHSSLDSFSSIEEALESGKEVKLIPCLDYNE